MKTFGEVYAGQQGDYVELCQYRLAKQVSKLMKDEDLKFSVQLTRDYVGFKNDEVTFLAIYSKQKRLILHIKVPEGKTNLCNYTVKSYDRNWGTANYDFVLGIADLEGFKSIILEAYKAKRKTN